MRVKEPHAPGDQDPERWQLTSQLVIHALLPDAGFTLPPNSETWHGVSVEQAYERLPEPPDDPAATATCLPTLVAQPPMRPVRLPAEAKRATPTVPPILPARTMARCKTAPVTVESPTRRRAMILPAQGRS